MRRIIPGERLTDLAAAGNAGLDAGQARVRLAAYGANDIVEAGEHPWRALLRETARDPMIWYLLGIGALYALVGSVADALVLLLATAPLIGMDAFLHRRSQASTATLSRQIAPTACAWRDGALLTVAARELVPGDHVRVVAGEAFPADGVIIDGHDAQTDESTLTGEAVPARKRVCAWPPPAGDDEPAVPDESWGFAGTRLLTGEARMLVVFTGRQTLYGEIVTSAQGGDRARTPTQMAITHLVNVLMAVAAALCAVLAFARYRLSHDVADALVSAATLAVAALPDEFPVVFTVFLGLGVYRLAARRALVRRGVSVENIGRITCICTDKTGTLTEGRLRIEALHPAPGITDLELLTLLAHASRRESGDPLDIAILDHHAASAPATTPAAPLALFPFTEQRRRETVVFERHGDVTAIAKGSPESLLGASTLDDTGRAAWLARLEVLAAEGLRVLACMRWQLGQEWNGIEPDGRGEFLGLVACVDPLREGVVAALAECRAAGIRVIMVTGDHPATARAIARRMGLGGAAPGIISGEALHALIAQATPQPLAGIDVVARALPTHKLELVEALRREGEIVAVTGDGVNDVPALKAADVGIAMGERGSRSARETAAIILLDDDFSTLVAAIAAGRQLFRNLRLSFAYLLMFHIPLVVTAAVIPLLGYPLLYLPVHVVWLELVIHPTALLVFQELPDSGPLAREERGGPEVRFFTGREWARIALTGALLTALVTASFDRSLLPGGDVAHARAMALAGLTAASAALTALLSGLRTRMACLLAAGTLALSVFLIQVPLCARWLHLAPLHVDDWAVAVLGAGACVLLPRLVLGRGLMATRTSAALQAARRQ